MTYVPVNFVDGVVPLNAATLNRLDQAIVALDARPTGGGAVGEWLFSTTTSEPPSSGQVRIDNAAQNAATKAWVANLTAPGVDAKNWLMQAKLGDQLYVQDKDDASLWQLYNITGPAVDKTSYVEIPVAWAQGGAAIQAQRIALQIIHSTAGGAIPGTIIDAKGDLIAGSAPDTAARLGVGTTGQVLTADAAQALGMKWAQPAYAPIPVSLTAPTSGAFWQVTNLGTAPWAAGHWEYPDGASSLIYGTVLVPAGVTAATLRVILGAAATTGNVTVAAAVASAADGETLAISAWDIANASQVVSMAGTAWHRKDATWALTGLQGRDLLPVAVYRVGADAGDTMTGNLGLFGAWLEP